MRSAFPYTTARRFAKGPWPEVPAVEMPTGDTSIPISFLRDIADALLKRPGATATGNRATRLPQSTKIRVLRRSY